MKQYHEKLAELEEQYGVPDTQEKQSKILSELTRFSQEYLHNKIRRMSW